MEIYRFPATPFVAQFIGTSTVIDDFRGYKGFGEVPSGAQAIIRPEFLEAFKNDSPKFGNLVPMAETGVIKDIAFRGSSLTLTVEVNGRLMTLNRSLERREMHVGETVNVLFYRAYVLENGTPRTYTNSLLEGVDVEGL